METFIVVLMALIMLAVITAVSWTKGKEESIRQGLMSFVGGILFGGWPFLLFLVDSTRNMSPNEVMAVVAIGLGLMVLSDF